MMDYVSKEQLDEQLVTLSLLPDSRWKNLLNLDIIKVRLGFIRMDTCGYASCLFWGFSLVKILTSSGKTRLLKIFKELRSRVH